MQFRQSRPPQELPFLLPAPPPSPGALVHLEGLGKTNQPPIDYPQEHHNTNFPAATRMIEKHILKITQELKLQARQVAATAVLLEEGATVPFIARYRKEKTGELDEVQITAVRDRLEQLAELDKRRDSILHSLLERSLLTDVLKSKIEASETLSALEDLYLPYRLSLIHI